MHETRISENSTTDCTVTATQIPDIPISLSGSISLNYLAISSEIPIPLSGSISVIYLAISSEIPIPLSGSISLSYLAISSTVRLDFHSVVPFL